jgi:hypothetical protein
VRGCLVAFGGFAVIWSTLTLPTFWRDEPLERIARQVVAGDVFVGDGLATLLPAVEAIEQADRCIPEARHAAAVIRVRMTEDVVAAVEPARLDASLAALRTSIRGALACSPADPFLWMVLFWVENAVEGLKPEHFAYLRMSYALGPNEGWIALKRSRYALALYAVLPPDLAKRASTEFVGLINTGFVREAAAIFAASGWGDRALLLPHLKELPLFRREAFARAVRDAGFDAEVPGVKRADPRPWN